MRALNKFTVAEWLKGVPIRHALKQARNDVWLAIYKKKTPENLDVFLQGLAPLTGKNIGLVVAFEQPWALDWLLRMAKRHLKDTTVLVFDNSRRIAARADIARVCASHQVPYLALPVNFTRHVNRSHGMAMTWIFHRVVRVIQPHLFAFLDHDLIPVQDICLADRLVSQPFYGRLGASKNSSDWQLWAGYSMFRYAHVADIDMNFLYDFSRELDTGGRNWKKLYRNHDRSQVRFASNTHRKVRDPVTGEVKSLQIIDEKWFHIGSISYNDNFKTKSQFCENLAQALDQGTSFESLCNEAQAVT